MKRLAFISGGSLALIFAALTACLYFTGWIGSSKARVEGDHSIDLPESVSDISCHPLISTRFIDDSFVATFRIDPKDLQSILDQIPEEPKRIEPLSSRFQGFIVPADFTDLMATYEGWSRDGNLVIIETYKSSGPDLGIYIYTSWN